MRKWQVVGIAALIAVMFCSPAGATVVLSPGSAASLKGALDSITVGGNSSVNVQTDQATYDDYWAISASGTSVNTIALEIAGFASSLTFGVYDATDYTKSVQIFPGAATTGAQAYLSILADGSVLVNAADTGIDFAGNAFGYYLTTPEGSGFRYASDEAKNLDGLQHMIAYEGKGVDSVQILPYSAGIWGANEYILAWEDLYNGGDKDYNDFMVMVESVKPVPEPGTMMLLGSGLVGLAGWGRKKFRK